MDSIAVTKPDMGALSRGRLTVSPFGVLSHAFARELLARSGFEEGRWPFVPLDLLEEGEPAPSGPPVQPVVQVDLSLILQAMRRTENRAEWEKAAERIVERVIVLEKRGRGPAAPVRTAAQRPPQASGQGTDLRPARGEKRAPGPEPADSAAAPPAVRQSFYNTVNQHIRLTANLIRYEAAGGLPDGPAFRRTAPGGLRGHASEYFRQGALSRGERTGSALPGDFTEARALGEAAGPVLWAEDGPDRRTRAQGRIGARAAARWNPGDAAPEALFHPEGGGDIGTTGTDAAAAIQRGAQRIAGQLAALWTAGHPRAGGRPGGGPSGRVAAPEAVEGLRLPPRTRFEPILSRDGTAPAVLLDGLHRMQTAQGADRTAGWPWPSLTVRRRLEPRSAPAWAGLTDSQRPETGGQPGEATLPDSRSRTRTPRRADAVQGADRLSPDGALAGQELRPRALTARDIRLNAAPPTPPEGPAAGGLPEGELSHWARPEEERTLGQPLPPARTAGKTALKRGADAGTRGAPAGRTASDPDLLPAGEAPGRKRGRGKPAKGAAGAPDNRRTALSEKPPLRAGRGTQRQEGSELQSGEETGHTVRPGEAAGRDIRLTGKHFPAAGAAAAKAVEGPGYGGPEMALPQGQPAAGAAAKAVEGPGYGGPEMAFLQGQSAAGAAAEAVEGPGYGGPEMTLLQGQPAAGAAAEAVKGPGYGGPEMALPQGRSAAGAAAEAVERTEESGPAEAVTQPRSAYVPRDIRAAGPRRSAAEPGGEAPRTAAMPAPPEWAALPPDAELTHRADSGQAADPAPRDGGRDRSDTERRTALEESAAGGAERGNARSSHPEAAKPAGKEDAPSAGGEKIIQGRARFTARDGIRATGAARPDFPGWTPRMAGAELTYRTGAEGAAGLAAAAPGVQAGRRAGQGPAWSGAAASQNQTPAASAAGPAGQGGSASGDTPPDAGLRRQTAVSARDIRLFRWEQAAPAGGEAAQREQAAPPDGGVPRPEPMAYRAREAGTYGAREPDRQGDGRPGGSAPVQTALAGQSAGIPDAGSWLREQLAERMGRETALRSAPPAPPRGRAGGEQRAAASGGGEAGSLPALPEWLELTYGPREQPPDGAADRTAARGPMDSDYVRGLPDWARRFLQEGAPQTREEAVRTMGTVRRTMGTARAIAAPPLPEGEAVMWTAPDYRAPAAVEYREPSRQQEQPQARSVPVSDAELQRTADRVYRIIEERIRRERHRLGL